MPKARLSCLWRERVTKHARKADKPPQTFRRGEGRGVRLTHVFTLKRLVPQPHRSQTARTFQSASVKDNLAMRPFSPNTCLSCDPVLFAWLENDCSPVWLNCIVYYVAICVGVAIVRISFFFFFLVRISWTERGRVGWEVLHGKY